MSMHITPGPSRERDQGRGGCSCSRTKYAPLSPTLPRQGGGSKNIGVCDA